MPALEHLFGSQPIEVSNQLIGAKRAVKVNKVVYVSPAMFDLLTSSTGLELKKLMDAIQVIDLSHIDGRIPVIGRVALCQDTTPTHELT